MSVHASTITLPVLATAVIAGCGSSTDETTAPDDPASQAEAVIQRLKDAGYTVSEEPFDPESEDPVPVAGYKVRGDGVEFSMLAYSDPSEAIEAAQQFGFVSASGKSADQGDVETADSRLYYGVTTEPKIYPDERFRAAVRLAESQ